MKEILQQDLFRYIGNRNKSLINRLRYIIFTPGFQYIYCFRHVNSSRNPLSRLFWKILLRRCMFHSVFRFRQELKSGRVLEFRILAVLWLIQPQK